MEHSNEDAYLLIALRKGEVIAFDSIFKNTTQFFAHMGIGL